MNESRRIRPHSSGDTLIVGPGRRVLDWIAGVLALPMLVLSVVMLGRAGPELVARPGTTALGILFGIIVLVVFAVAWFGLLGLIVLNICWKLFSVTWTA